MVDLRHFPCISALFLCWCHRMTPVLFVMFWRYGQVWWEWPSHPPKKNDKVLRVGNCQEVESPKKETPFFQPQSFRYYLYSSFRQKYVTVHFEMLLQATSFRFCFSRDGPWKFTWNPKIEFWKISFEIFNHGWFLGSMWIFRGVQTLKKHLRPRAWCRWRMITWTLAPLWVAPHKTVAKALECGPPQGRMEGRFYTIPFGVAGVAVDVIGFFSMISIDSQVKEKGKIYTDVWDLYGYIITYMSIILERKMKRNQSVWVPPSSRHV